MVWRGLDCGRSGFLIFFRSPGANKNTNLWAEDTSPILWNRPHDPQLPAEITALFPEPPTDHHEY